MQNRYFFSCFLEWVALIDRQQNTWLATIPWSTLQIHYLIAGAVRFSNFQQSKSEQHQCKCCHQQKLFMFSSFTRVTLFCSSSKLANLSTEILTCGWKEGARAACQLVSCERKSLQGCGHKICGRPDIYILVIVLQSTLNILIQKIRVCIIMLL